MVAARRTSKADWKVAGHVYGGKINARFIKTLFTVLVFQIFFCSNLVNDLIQIRI
jgi:hypothetical protein